MLLQVSSRREGHQDPIRSKEMDRLKQILETLALDSASATAVRIGSSIPVNTHVKQYV